MAVDNEELLARVRGALSGVTNPQTGEDVLSSGQVQELRLEDDGRVRFAFELRPEDPGSLVKEARGAVEAVEGVGRARIDVHLPQNMQNASQAPPQRGPQAGTVPAPTPQSDMLPDVQHVVAVSSGKGGVGKSTVAVNLAVALAAAGHRVGLLDADIYGPDVPLMFGERRKPMVSGEHGKEKIVPLEMYGVKFMSLGLLLDEDQPAIMRGPLISGLLRQFLEQVEWGALDVMVVDMPPGTGDAQLSLVQTIDLDGAVMVTTPQEVSTADVRRAIRMFERVNTTVLGLVENMSGFVCPNCGELHEIFGSGGGRKLAETMDVPLLGEVPLDTEVRRASDVGAPTTVAAPDSPAGQAFRSIAEALAERIGAVVTAG
ncbi:MAG TPA: Mrp/NBP35 family ATP-binding protein [Longimicrobiales bacterium]|nr:Mrp/NBP35 family ATP-binding protein [Longimicrobiales bacterium]